MDSKYATFNQYSTVNPNNTVNAVKEYDMQGQPAQITINETNPNDINTQPPITNRMQNALSDPNVLVSSAQFPNAYDKNQQFHPYERQTNQLKNTYCPGRNMSTYIAPGAAACGNACTKNNNCKTWTFDKRRQICNLKNNAHPCHANINFTSGHVTQPPQPNPVPPRTSNVMPGTALDGRTFSTYLVPNQNVCKNNCIDNKNCTAWSFNHNKRTCMQKNGQQYPYRDPAVVSGRVQNRVLY